jgi:ornithine carbamoyltransferase
MNERSLISLQSLSASDVRSLVASTLGFAHAERPRCVLDGKRVGLLFERPSTRTRTTFAIAVNQLGGFGILYGPGDLQTCTGESLDDTGMVLAEYLDCIVVRSFHSRDLERLGKYLPVINALTEDEHPTQALADIATILEEFGSLADKHLLFVGEAGNISISFCIAALSYPGSHVSLLSPNGFGLPEPIIEDLRQRAARSGSVFEELGDPDQITQAADVVYTTRWRSMGQEKTLTGWRERFEPLSITSSFMRRFGAEKTVVLHDLPAEHDAEVSAEVLHGHQSRILRQAKNKLFSAMASLEWVARGTVAHMNASVAFPTGA